MLHNEFQPAAIRATLACCLVSLFSAAPIIGATFGIFMVDMSADFGWGRSLLSGVTLVITATIALTNPILGIALDRWGVRRLLLPAMAIYALAVMALSLSNGSLLQVFGLYFAVALFGAPVGPLSIAKIVTGWFNAKRGLVLGITSGVGGGIGLALAPQLARVLFEDFGWRGAYFALGALVLFVGLPLVIWLLKEPPSMLHVTSQREFELQQQNIPGATASEARRSRTFWLLLTAVVLITLGIGGVLHHLVPMLTDRGVPRGEATNVLSFMALSLLAGQVLSGMMMDRFQSPRVAMPFYALTLLGVVLLHHSNNSVLLFTGGVLLGMGLGAETSMVPYYVTRYFGLRSFGAVLGSILPFSALAAGVGPLIMGGVFDLTGSYDPALYLLEIAQLLAIVFLLLLGPFVYAAHSTEPTPIPAQAKTAQITS